MVANARGAIKHHTLFNSFPAAKRIAAGDTGQRIVDAKGKLQVKGSRCEIRRTCVDKGDYFGGLAVASIHFAIHQRQCAAPKIDFGILLQRALLVR